MSERTIRPHISDFCGMLSRQAEAEERRLRKDPDDVYDGFDDKPRPLDAVADFLSRRTGLKREDVLAYIHRAGGVLRQCGVGLLPGVGLAVSS